MKEARQTTAVIITFIKPNKNSPVLQQLRKSLSPCTNTLSLPAKRVFVDSEILSWKLLKSRDLCCFLLLLECGDLFYTLSLVHCPHIKRISRFVYGELLLESGTENVYAIFE